MKISIKVKKRHDESNVRTIEAELNIPAGDYPYFVDFQYDKDSDVGNFIVEYLDSDEKRHEYRPQTDITLNIGAKSGRIYQLTISKFRNFASSDSHLCIDMHSIFKTEVQPRIKNNFHFGRNILNRSLEFAKEAQTQLFA